MLDSTASGMAIASLLFACINETVVFSNMRLWLKNPHKKRQQQWYWRWPFKSSTVTKIIPVDRLEKGPDTITRIIPVDAPEKGPYAISGIIPVEALEKGSHTITRTIPIVFCIKVLQP